MNAIAFHCSACGSCCNSAPAMTVPELFHHERRFVGSLSVQWLPRHRVGDRLRAGQAAHTLSTDDVAAIDALADALLHPTTPTLRFALRTRALDEPSLGACPARLGDGRCGVHDDGKPATCGTVPLDPLWPDRLQHLVLLGRIGDVADGGYADAGCIVADRPTTHPPLVAAGRIVDADYRDRTARQRTALAAEKTAWGDAVAALLRPQLLAAGGHLSLPLTPVLDVLADASAAASARCIDYAERQIALIDMKVTAALQRRNPADKPVTRQLRNYAQSYAGYIAARRAPPATPARSAHCRPAAM